MSVPPPGAEDRPEGTGAPGSEQQPGGRHASGDPDQTQVGAEINGPLSTDTTVTLGAVGPPEGEVTDAGLTAADQVAIDALPSGSALLVVRRGPNAGARFLLDGERTTAGRRPDSDIFLDDVTVSRKHAEFIRREGRFVVRDVGSLNGTYVQRDRIEEATLRAGDEVQIGKYRMIFHPSRRDAGAGAGW
jgi:pSer/pThr/pTyr-binding forkhead associated (FHA) protein